MDMYILVCIWWDCEPYRIADLRASGYLHFATQQSDDMIVPITASEYDFVCFRGNIELSCTSPKNCLAESKSKMGKKEVLLK